MLPVAVGLGGQLGNPFELTLLGGIGAALRERRRDFSICWQTPHDDQSLAEFVKEAPYRGFIFFGQSQFHDTLNRLAATHVPMVVWGVETEDQKYCSVGTDNFDGGFRATRHMIRTGRKRVAFVGSMPPIAEARTALSQIAQRVEGYKAALASEGVSYDPGIVQTPLSSRYEGANSVENLIERGVAFDAIVAASDIIALGAIQALQRYGRRVPEDGRQLRIEFRVFDDGFGFRYILPGTPDERFVISDELTQFAFAQNYRAWWIPAYREKFSEYEYSRSALSAVSVVQWRQSRHWQCARSRRDPALHTNAVRPARLHTRCLRLRLPRQAPLQSRAIDAGAATGAVRGALFPGADGGGSARELRRQSRLRLHPRGAHRLGAQRHVARRHRRLCGDGKEGPP